MRRPQAGAYRRGMLRLLLAITLLLGGVLPPAQADSAHTGVDVGSDDARDEYVGTGALLLPTGAGGPDRHAAAACGDCRWRFTTPCAAADVGRPFDGQVPCRSVSRGCVAGDRLLRPWLQIRGGPWRPLGVVCIGPAGPVTVVSMAVRVREALRTRLPGLAPRHQPERGVVTQLPVLFDSGQAPGLVSWEPTLAGRRVSVRARAAWTWSFGDGASVRTTSPGGAYPRSAVEHTYRRAAGLTIGVQARWEAQFSVEGLGPFPVADPILQSAVLPIAVGEGRALLSGGGVAQ